MADLTEYAKQTAIRLYPNDPNRTSIYNSNQEANRVVLVTGILYLAEQLQREDVTEAGVLALDAFNKDITYYGFDAEEAQRECVAAMLTKIAEGADSVEAS